MAHLDPAALSGPVQLDSLDQLLRGPTPLLEPWPGCTLLQGRFRVGRRIGAGGMGCVYEALDSEAQQRVALKTMLRLDPRGVYRLKNECRALRDVRHPNLAVLHDLFVDEGRWFFTMELVEGVHWIDWVRPRAHGGAAACDESRLRASLSQLLAAVQAIHRAGKLHRDLKPSNVLVTPAGRTVVLDFGLVSDTEPGGIGHTLDTPTLEGTPAYLAPEQAAGKACLPASDYYAIGVMLFEALTGSLPFRGSVHDVLADKQRCAAPSDALAEAPDDLAALCRSLLDRDPARRRLPAAVARGLRPPELEQSPAVEAELVGREAELATLREALAAAVSGTPVLLEVCGESGIGKTALCESFLAELRARGAAAVLSGRCYERENVPFKGFDTLVDALSRHLRSLPHHTAAALMPREAFALSQLFPVLGRVAAVAEAPVKHVTDAHDLQRRAFAAFSELLGRLRDRTPVVVFIDDWQWTDSDSVRFLGSLLRCSEAPALLLILAYRAEDSSLLAATREAARHNRQLERRALQLGPLARAPALALFRRQLERTCETTLQALVRESAGNPFFVRALARAAAKQPGLDVTLRHAVSLQLGSLSAEAGRALSVIALAGQPLAPAIALAAIGCKTSQPLDELQREGLVRGAWARDGSRALECYHDKVRELASELLPPAVACELAAALAAALRSRSDADPELTARCLSIAGLAEDAAEYAARAADRALRVLAFDRAARLYDLALTRGRFDADRMQGLRVRHAEALAHAGRGVHAAQAYLDAREHAVAGAGELTRKAAQQYLLCGRVRVGRALWADALGPLGIRLPRSSHAALASLLWSRARLRARGLGFTPRASQSPAALEKLAALRAASHSFGVSDWPRCADLSARHVLLALASGNAVELARGLAREVRVQSLLGSPAEAIERVVKLATALCAQTDDVQAQHDLRGALGVYRMFRTGQPAAALADLDWYLEHASAAVSPTIAYDRPWAAYFKAEALGLLGRVAESAELAREQLELAQSSNHLSIVPSWVNRLCFTLPAVVASQPAEGELARAEREWSTLRDDREPSVDMQHTMLMIARLALAMHAGDARAAWENTREARERMRRARTAAMNASSLAEGYLCGIATAALAQTRDPSARRELRREIERCAKRARPSATLPPAALAVACARGEFERAIQLLHDTMHDPKTAPLFAQAARRRLGVMLGGDEGAALVATADAFFQAGGVRDPARYVAVVLPGVEPARPPRDSGRSHLASRDDASVAAARS